MSIEKHGSDDDVVAAAEPLLDLAQRAVESGYEEGRGMKRLSLDDHEDENKIQGPAPSSAGRVRLLLGKEESSSITPRRGILVADESWSHSITPRRTGSTRNRRVVD